MCSFECGHESRHQPKEGTPVLRDQKWRCKGSCRDCDNRAAIQILRRIIESHQRDLKDGDRKIEESRKRHPDEEFAIHMQTSHTWKVQEEVAEERKQLKKKRDQEETKVHTDFQKRWNTNITS